MTQIIVYSVMAFIIGLLLGLGIGLTKCLKEMENSERKLWGEDKKPKNHQKEMGAYEELKQPVWRKIKAGEHLPCRAYLWKLGFEDDKNFHGDCFVDGYLVPNEPVKVGCDTWYLPVDAIKNLPKEE